MRGSTRLAFVLAAVASLALLFGCNREKSADAPAPVPPASKIEPSELLKRLARDRLDGVIERRLVAKAPKIRFSAGGSVFTSKLQEHVQVVMHGGWESADRHPEYRRIVLAEIEEYLTGLVATVGAVVTDPISGRSEDGFVFGYTLGTARGTVEVSNPKKWKEHPGVGDFWIKASEVR
jgi:hypothetical protein